MELVEEGRTFAPRKQFKLSNSPSVETLVLVGGHFMRSTSFSWFPDEGGRIALVMRKNKEMQGFWNYGCKTSSSLSCYTKANWKEQAKVICFAVKDPTWGRLIHFDTVWTEAEACCPSLSLKQKYQIHKMSDRERMEHSSKGERGSDPGISHTPYFPIRTKPIARHYLDQTQPIYQLGCMGTFLLFTVNSETRDLHLSFIFTTFSRKIALSPNDIMGVVSIVLK